MSNFTFTEICFKCGKHNTTHKTGTCSACRTVTCSKCSKEYVLKKNVTSRARYVACYSCTRVASDRAKYFSTSFAEV